MIKCAIVVSNELFLLFPQKYCIYVPASSKSASLKRYFLCQNLCLQLTPLKLIGQNLCVICDRQGRHLWGNETLIKIESTTKTKAGS